MDQVDALLAIPSWAYDFCYYYLFVGAISVVHLVYTLVQLLMLPPILKKLLPITSMSISMVLTIVLVLVFSLMSFWICRGALKPEVEKFAANCQNAEDCTAIMGTPQPSYSECGARKKCGGYNMQNNMEPVGELSGMP